MCRSGKEATGEAVERAPVDIPFQCLVFVQAQSDLIPIYHWENKRDSHFYAADPLSAVALEATEAYAKNGVAWHIYPSRQGGSKTLPLVRWYDPVKGIYRYTASETGMLPPAPECKREAILGYVLVLDREAIPPPGTVPLPLPIEFPTSWFTFDSAFTTEQTYQILLAHSTGYDRAGVCTSLTKQQADQVRQLYWVRIHHGIDTDPHHNASASVGGRSIDVNIALLSLSQNEIAQTMLHEMLHCAGYRHPERVDPPMPSPDIPFDGGPYYGSVPLQGELCIAGNQSLTGSAQDRPCPVV